MSTISTGPIESISLNQGAHALIFGPNFSRMEVRHDDGAIHIRPSTRLDGGIPMMAYRHHGGLVSVKDSDYFSAVLPKCRDDHGAYFNLVKSADGWYRAEPATGRHPQKPQMRIFRRLPAIDVDHMVVDAYASWKNTGAKPSAAVLAEALAFVERHKAGRYRGRKPAVVVKAETLIAQFSADLTSSDQKRVEMVLSRKGPRTHQTPSAVADGSKMGGAPLDQKTEAVVEPRASAQHADPDLTAPSCDVAKAMAMMSHMFRAMADAFASGHNGNVGHV